MTEEVRINLDRVQHKIKEVCARAGRTIGSVRLIAVSKKQPIEKVHAAYTFGQRDFGENYVQELEERRKVMPADVRWHMIGHLQTNKAKRAVDAALVHGVDSERLARALSKPAEEGGRRAAVLVEVNLGGEANKSGVAPQDVEALLTAMLGMNGLSVLGLMCIPPPGEGRRHFAALRELRDHLVKTTGAPLPELSMGMSDDYEDAILEGSTLVRVGTAIFGARQ